MTERRQITYMQARMVRMAAERWHVTLKRVTDVFRKYRVFDYIEEGFGLFHMEGDEAIFVDISDYLQAKGFHKP